MASDYQWTELNIAIVIWNIFGKMPPKKTLIWTLFNVHPTDRTYRICKLCPVSEPKRNVKCGTDPKRLTSSNIQQHAALHHPKEYNETKLEQEKIDKQVKKRKTPDSGFSPCSTAKKQNTLHQCFEKKKLWDVTDSRASPTNTAIAKWIVAGCHPINIVEEPFFREMIGTLSNNYQVPSRDFITRRVIPSMNESLTSRIFDLMENVDNMSFSTDIWTAPHVNDCFLSLTGHFLTRDFDAHCVVLKAMHFDERHTADQISINLQKMLSEYNIPQSKVHYIVSDNASNITKGVVDIDVPHLSCFLHTLNLIINNSIFVQETNKTLIDKCKKLVKFYKKSPLAKSEFDSIEVEEGEESEFSSRALRLIQDIAIRWNSTCKMLARIWECKPRVATFLCETTLDIDIEITREDWIRIEKLVKILKQFEAITNQ